jgi:adenylyl-sulfate kinase
LARRDFPVRSKKEDSMKEAATNSTNIKWQGTYVTRKDRERTLGQHGCVLWFTGLSGSGKSTIASCLERQLAEAGWHCYTLDGDNIRHGLNGDLGFTEADRTENIRRISEVAALFCDAGLITLTAFISPFRADRDKARNIIEASARSATPSYLEIFIDTPIKICEQRDPKNLYKRAKAGEIANFTGIDSPYEPPASPDITIQTAECSPDEAARQIMQQLIKLKIISAHKS